MSHRRAFTMIELLVTISIIALLATLTFGIMNYAQSKALEKNTQAGMLKVRIALESFKEDHDRYVDFGDDIASDYAGSDITDLPSLDDDGRLGVAAGGHARPPGWQYDTADDSSGGEIATRAIFQETSFGLYFVLMAKGDYLDYPDNMIDPKAKDLASVDANKNDSDLVTAADFSEQWAWGPAFPANCYTYGLLDAWNQPLIYMYWNGDRPAVSVPAFEGFEKSYELWSAGPDMKFEDFRYTRVSGSHWASTDVCSDEEDDATSYTWREEADRDNDNVTVQDFPRE